MSGQTMKKSILLRNHMSEVDRLATAIIEFGEVNRLSTEVVFDIKLAAEELVVNVINYAYEDTEDHDISIDMDFGSDILVVTIKDDGKSFNPLDFHSANIEKPFGERDEGGMGIYLVRSLMDELSYKREQGRNILLMKKHVVNPTADPDPDVR
jgi:serine/threonine-protein kinase RsbW